MIHGVWHWTRCLVVLVPLVVACSGTKQKDAEVPTGEGSGENAGNAGSGEAGNEGGSGDGANESPKPHKSASSSSGSSEGGSGLNDSQKEMMEIILKRGAGKAANCSASVPDGKGGEGEVKVLFDGQKGRVTDVTVGAPWVGTSMESCIKRAWVGEIIVPFEGDPLEVPYDIKIPEKAGAAAADPKKPTSGKKK